MQRTRWRRDGFNRQIQAFRAHETATCDFCEVDPVVWVVDTTGGGEMAFWTSTGKLFACNPCGTLIRAGNKGYLQKRGSRNYGKRDHWKKMPPDVAAMVIDRHLHRFYEGFWEEFTSLIRIEL